MIRLLQPYNFIPCLLFVYRILNEFVQKTPSLDERKDQRDLQDVTQRLLTACSEIAGASLEQTTWLRRNLAVKPGPQIDILENDDAGTDQEGNYVFNIKKIDCC